MKGGGKMKKTASLNIKKAPEKVGGFYAKTKIHV